MPDIFLIPGVITSHTTGTATTVISNNVTCSSVIQTVFQTTVGFRR